MTDTRGTCQTARSFKLTHRGNGNDGRMMTLTHIWQRSATGSITGINIWEHVVNGHIVVLFTLRQSAPESGCTYAALSFFFYIYSSLSSCYFLGWWAEWVTVSRWGLWRRPETRWDNSHTGCGRVRARFKNCSFSSSWLTNTKEKPNPHSMHY